MKVVVTRVESEPLCVGSRRIDEANLRTSAAAVTEKPMECYRSVTPGQNTAANLLLFVGS